MTYFRKLKSPVREKPSFWRLHHFFTGILIALGGFGLVYTDLWQLADLLVGLGVWNIVDDLKQHQRQMAEWRETGEYQTVSFLHWVFEQFRGEEYAA